MITIKKKIDMDTRYLKTQFEDITTLLFFDIETTGFSYRKKYDLSHRMYLHRRR